MKQNEWLGCVNELQPGDRVTNVTDVSQVSFRDLKRKVNQATVVLVEEVFDRIVYDDTRN